MGQFQFPQGRFSIPSVASFGGSSASEFFQQLRLFSTTVLSTGSGSRFRSRGLWVVVGRPDGLLRTSKNGHVFFFLSNQPNESIAVF